MSPRFSLNKVSVRQGDHKPWRGDFADEPVRGKELTFEVIDDNLPRLNQWQFVVLVPDSRAGYIQVQPTRVPRRRMFKDVTRRVLTFHRGTMPDYTNRVYCPAAFEDVGGDRTKRTARRGERSRMPYWLRPLKYRMRLKPTVRRTRGTDVKAQVIVLRPNDYTTMIRAYMALRSWPLLTGRGLD